MLAWAVCLWNDYVTVTILKENVGAAGSLHRNTWHSWRSGNTGQRQIWDAVKAAGKIMKHGADFLLTGGRAHGWEMKKMSYGWSGADTHSCWEESRGSFPISRNTWNVWPTDGTPWRNFPCCFPPPKTPLAFTSETAGRVDLRISLRVGHEKASSWEMNWQWIDRTVGATLPI